MAGKSISTTISKEVVLGSGVYTSPLTVTSTGFIRAPAPKTSFQSAAAIYANVIGGSIINRGAISGAIPVTDSYTAPAIFSTNPLDIKNYGIITGQSGIYLQDGGTITNSGTIAGDDARTHGGYGVRLTGGVLINSKTVYGKSDGVAEWNASEVVNSGTVSGAAAGISLVSDYSAASGTLVNSGRIAGGASGVTETGAIILNSGSIGGQSYGLRSNWGGAVTNANSGDISGGVDGVLLLDAQYQAKYATSLINFGTLQGGYFGLAINFAYATNELSGVIAGTAFGAGVGASGYLFNRGSIYGVDGGLLTESGGRAGNSGSVSGAKLGIELFYDSALTNASAGAVYSAGTAALDQAAYLINAGTIAGNSYGVEILSGGIAVNSGTVSSRQVGVYLSTLSATPSPDFLGNTGTIYGLAVGIDLQAGTAENYGRVTGQIAVSLAAGAVARNAGTIYGSRYGVQLQGGTLVNAGAIAGGTDGVRLSHGDLTNSGTITGAQYAVYGQSLSLTIDPSAAFKGNVLDRAGAGRLNLAGSTPGTLSGLGGQFSGFDTIDFAAGAAWLISGTTAALTAKQVIGGFERGDTIVVTGFSAASDSFVANTGLKLISGTLTQMLDITGSFTTANFSVSSSGTATTIALQPNAPCFVAGTRILTSRGEIAVEELAAGDRVITRRGEDRTIVWIGHRTIDLRLHPRPAEVQPVCIAANALGEAVPRRDLWLSPDHALLIEEFLVPAQLLLNGLNIYQASRARVTYYHVELTQHDVIFAEHAPAESYLETGNRNAFENAGGAMLLHPDFSALLRREKSCAPLLQAGAQLDRIRQRSLRRYVPNRSRFNA